MYVSPTLSTEMLRMSGLKSRVACVAVGRSILMDSIRIIVRLASMNAASRKNMMSIRGMISMRAFLCGQGEPIFMSDAGDGFALGRCSSGCLRRFVAKLDGVDSLFLRGVDHDFD